MSQWVDVNGDQWRFSTVTGAWRKLVNGTWTITPLPSGGLQRVTTGTVTETITAPPWPADDPDHPHWDGDVGGTESRDDFVWMWVDAQGDPWRFSTATGFWQKLVNNVWVNDTPPFGGLQKIGDDTETPNVVVVETMGPQGEEGPPGPTGPGGLGALISETLPAQLQDGVKNTFSISETVDLTKAIQVFRNGLMEILGQGYLVTDNSVTFTTPPMNSDVIAIVYQKAQ